MELIKSFEQYREIVGKGKNLPDSCSNCYFLPGAVKDKIERGVLYVMHLQSGILLLEQEPTFYRCYYYLSPRGSFVPLRLPMRAVVEFIFQENMTESQDMQIHCLQQMGFHLGRESGRMHLDAGEADTKTEGLAEIALEWDANDIYAMIEENFDPLYAFIGERDELLDAIRKKCVFVIRENEVPVAALHAEIQKGVASIRHLVVSKNCRAQGYGRSLVLLYHSTFQDEVRTFSLWVDKANAAAIRLYTKLGYSFDGRYANEYII